MKRFALYLEIMNPSRWYDFKKYKTYNGAVQAYNDLADNKDFKNVCTNIKLEIGKGKIEDCTDNSISIIDRAES